MSPNPTDLPLRTMMRLKRRDGGLTVVRTIDQAADFLRAYSNGMPNTRLEGVLRRLEVAGSDTDKIEAGDAFRAWCDAEGLVTGAAEQAGVPANDEKPARRS